MPEESGRRGWPRRTRRIAVRRELSHAQRLIYGLTGIVLLFGLWQGVSALGWINPLAASSPWHVAQSAKGLVGQGALGPAVLSSAKLFGIGFGLSLAIGFVGGMILGWYVRLNAIFDPWLSLFYATPRIALIPLIIVWIGVDLRAQVVVVCLIAVFPIMINVSRGVAAIDRDHLRVARSFLATNRDVLLTVALPGAVPHLVTAVRQGIVMGLVGVVVAEYFFGGNAGVGGLIFTSGLTLRTSQAYVGALVFAGAAIAMTGLLQIAERRLDRWRTSP